MTLFWVYAVLLTAVALAILITPLVRSRATASAAVSRAASNLTVFRDQIAELDADLAAGTIGREQWEAARGDLQRGLLEGSADEATVIAALPVARSKAAAIAIGIALPLASVLLYLGVGNMNGLEPARQQAGAQGAPHELSREQIESMVMRLAQRMESSPDDGGGWVMLARTYSAIGRWGDAAAAYAKAVALFPQDAQLLADYADTLAMVQGRRLQGKPEALVQRALKADGNNLKALALAGTVDFEKGDYAKAIGYWQRMLPLLPADSEMGNSVRASIQDAQSKLGRAPKSLAAVAPDRQGGATKSSTATTAAAKPSSLTGTIKLAPALAARAGPEDAVFVLARPAQGSRTPLAAVRVKVKDLPLNFSFDDSMAMNPSAKLSDFAEVVVAARVSKSGNVVPQRGDLEGVSKPVRPGAAGVVIEIANEVQ